MLMLLPYLPHIIFAGLIALAVVVMFSDDGRKKRVFPQRIRQQYYAWNEHNPRRD